MRTFNGLQIFTPQLTNSGQLDARYVTLNTDQTITGLKTFKNNIILNPSYVPSHQFSPGYSGQISFNMGYIFVCISGNGTNGDWRAVGMGAMGGVPGVFN
jgi:hypothetical protein